MNNTIKEIEMSETYKIVRIFINGDRRPRGVRGLSGLTLKEAQEHCQDLETSSKTCTNRTSKTRTKNQGPWFDAFTAE